MNSTPIAEKNIITQNCVGSVADTDVSVIGMLAPDWLSDVASDEISEGVIGKVSRSRYLEGLQPDLQFYSNYGSCNSGTLPGLIFSDAIYNGIYYIHTLVYSYS